MQYPAVTHIRGDADMVEANRSISEFALQMCVFSSKFATDKGWTTYGFTDKHGVPDLIAQHYKAWAFPIWDWALAQFFGNNDVILEYEQCGSLYASAQTESHLIEMTKRLGELGIAWEKLRPPE
jgi:hypothetical protein